MENTRPTVLNLALSGGNGPSYSTRTFGKLCIVFAGLAFAGLAHSQTTPQSPSRADDVEQARAAKEKHLTPEVPGAAEQKVIDVEDSPWLTRIIGPGGGLKLGFGGMAAGAAGFSLGPNWSRSDIWGERIHLNVALRASTNHSYLGSFSLVAPDLLDNKAFAGFSVTHRDYSQVPFYGIGPDSRKTGRSDYRLEDTTLEFRPGVRPLRHLQVGGIGGWYFANVGPGTSTSYISTGQQFSPAAAPGINRQGGFLRSGVFATYDRRGPGTEPVSGYRYAAEWVRMSDLDFGAYSHGRLDLDVQHYISFFNDRRTIALHGHTTLTDTRPNEAVPFYLQPSLGGPDTLRGFRPFRFTGANAMWMNGEYRWEAGTVLDVVLFADGGKVFDRWEQLNVHGLQGSGGFGLNFKVRQDLAFRFDTGFSHEGVQLWLRFNNAF